MGELAMGQNISQCIEIYQKQLIQGDIRFAYMTLIKYMRELKAQFPSQYSTGNLSLGYLDYTYFPFFNEYLRQRKLRFGIVLNHLEMRFELWLMGQNAPVQKTYWKLLRNTDWNKNKIQMPQYSVLEVCLEDVIDFNSKELMRSKIFTSAISLAGQIQDFLKDFE